MFILGKQLPEKAQIILEDIMKESQISLCRVIGVETTDTHFIVDIDALSIPLDKYGVFIDVSKNNSAVCSVLTPEQNSTFHLEIPK